MGALIAMWCKYFGAKYIGVVEQNKHRAFNIMDYNETTCIFDANDPNIVETLINATGGFNVHFECSGNPKYISIGVLALRRGSTIATLSLYPKSMALNFYMMSTKLIRLRPFNAHTISDYDEVVKLVSENKKLNLKRYLSTSIKLDEIQEMLTTLSTEDHQHQKVVINKFE